MSWTFINSNINIQWY